MTKTQKRKRVFLLIFAALFLYGGTMAFIQFREYQRINKEQKTVQQQINQANLEKQALENTILYADSDEYIESIVRDRLGWVKKGETRYYFTKPEKE